MIQLERQSIDRPTFQPPPALVVPLLLAIFICALVFFTRNNDFPYYYHPDEPSKVRQIVDGELNYHHPLLLIESTRFACALLETPMTNQAIARAGRTVSAFYTALAVTLLAWLAFLYRGFGAAVVLALLLITHQQFFELAHYFKEDPVLLAGIAFCCLAMEYYGRLPSLPRAALLGFAAGVAISGKFVGATGAAACLVTIGFTPVGGAYTVKRRKRWRVLWFFLVLLGTFLVVQAPLLEPGQFGRFLDGFDREVSWAVGGHKELTRSVPHLDYTASFSGNTNAFLWVFMIVYIVGLWRSQRGANTARWTTALFAPAYAVMLSFSPKVNDRYFLPATAVFMFVAVIGMVDASRWLSFSLRLPRALGFLRRQTGCLTVLTLVALALQIPEILACYRAFREDDRQALVAFVAANLPATAKIAQDTRVNLPGDPRKPYLLERAGEIPQQVEGGRFAADLGSCADLRRQGFTHVAVCEGDYGRFFRENLTPKPNEKADYDRRRLFYDTLFRDGRLLWERPSGEVLYFQPGLRLYELRPAPEVRK